MDSIVQMMKDCYKMIDSNFEPTEKDIQSYKKVLDKNNDGKVTLYDIE